jgi:hypothetical protein
MVKEISIQLHYEKHSDGRYHIRSLEIPGFRMAGMDLDALQRDLDEVVKDLLLSNSGIAIESIRWVPSLEDVRTQLDHPRPEGKATYVATLKAAA